jgi:hypothetical protein
LEVQKLVASGSPEDNARLGAHFTALADKAAAEARQHQTMSRAFGGNPARQLGTAMSVHCERLARLNIEAAATRRELAAHHNRLAAGRRSIAPPDAARYQSGKGARVPAVNELSDLAAKASTPAEHRALEEYFVTLARRFTTDANEHVALAQTYRGSRIAQAAVHHDRLAGLSRDSAKEATEAAEMHKDLAGSGR